MSKDMSKLVIKSIRLPDRIWSLLKKNADKNYRTLNSHFLKIIEDNQSIFLGFLVFFHLYYQYCSLYICLF